MIICNTISYYNDISFRSVCLSNLYNGCCTHNNTNVTYNMSGKAMSVR